MRYVRGSLLPLVLAALLAGLTYWLDHVVQAGDASQSARSRHDPDYFVDHFTVRRFGPDGTLQHTITADRMVHFPDNDTTEVTAPHLVYESPQTDITARTAWLDSKGKHVRLNDDVRIARTGSPGLPETVITTSELFVTPDDETAHTEAPVIITQGKSVVTGVGLEANNKTEIAVLSGRVHGTIYRSKNK
jgi:lipopolysaccharide export system protein LptC